MTPIINHVYSCTWDDEDLTYFNLVTNIDSTFIYGRCISCLDPDFISKDTITWYYYDWSHEDSHIIDLGHMDDLPELFI